eukprot:PhF_6_TR18695/c0_g1_i1/m.27325
MLRSLSRVATGGRNVLLLNDLLQTPDHAAFLTRPSTNNPDHAKMPLVLLLGWGGSTRKQLDRYIQLYSSEGCSIISAIAPMESYVRGVPEDLSLNVMKTIDTELSVISKNGIHVHLMSNNGFLMYYALMKKDEKRTLAQVRSMTIDSAPTIHFSSLMAPLTLAVMFKFALPPYASTSTLWLTWVLFWTRLEWHQMRSRSETSIDNVNAITQAAFPKTAPVIFMVGKNDKLIPPSEIRAYMERVKKIPTTPQNITMVEMESGHCALLKTHPKEYKEVMSTFLSKHYKSRL